MNAIGYIRVSTDSQADDGVSLDAQRERIIDYCTRQNIALATIEADEGLSGKRADNRPGLRKALKAVCRAKGVLVVYSLSRLTRSIRDLLDIFETLQKADADLVSITESFDTTSAMGRFAFKLFGLVAELERELIGERTSAALAHKRRKGEKTGGQVPYGFTVLDDEGVKRLVPVEDEQKIIRQLNARHDKGEGYKSLASWLNRERVPTRTGAPWSAKVIKGIIRRQASTTI